MKRILIATALSLAAAGSSFAMASNQTLPVAGRAEAQALVPSGDFSHLTVAQAGAIAAVLYGANTQRASEIRSILNWN